MEKESTYKNIPVITLRGVVVFPGSKVNFDIIRKQSILALNEAMDKDKKLFFVAQKDFSIENPKLEDIYNIGVIAKVSQILRNENGNIKISIETQKRAKILNLYKDQEMFIADIEVIKEDKYKCDDIYLEALIKTAKDMFNRYCGLIKNISDEDLFGVLKSDDPIFVVNYITSNVVLDVDAKQKILETNKVSHKLELLISGLSHELDLIFLERDILEKLNKQIDKNQRDYYLKEQMKVISEELGEESPIEEKKVYEEKIKKLKINNHEIEKKLLKEVEKLSKISYYSPEATVVRGYLDVCIDLPWNKVSKDKIDIEKAQKILDKDHYGLQDVKERILELLSVMKIKKQVNGLVLCLCGPPGVGKTSIVKSIAKVMNRKYAKVSLGGIRDESEIRGHRRTYIGSMPGRIIEAIKMTGVKNPVILLDEIDKMGDDYKGDPVSAMLEVLDVEQNNEFLDHYLDLPFDLSEVLFIATANDRYMIPGPLLDRMEIIDITSYTEEEKYHIAKEHLIDKEMKFNGLTKRDVKINDQAIYDIIHFYTSEAGVRGLEREIAKIMRKIAQKKARVGNEKYVKDVVTKSNLFEYLGVQKYKTNKLLERDEVGVVTGLAWTSVGGEVMHIEVSVLEGEGRIEMTGNLGDIMKESARAAISYVRSKTKDLGIDKEFYKHKDIHIHVPEGAVPKDGPSAGVAICTAIVSELTKRPIKRDIAMTGEITLRGRVLPIGGLKEKSMAAYKTGVKTVYLPKDNEADLYNIDPKVKESIKFVLVNKVDKVLNEVLVR